MGFDDLQILVEAVRAKKAERIVALDLRGKSDVCDFQLICSANNENQSRAIAASVDAACRERLGVRPAAIEGQSAGTWILMDYGQVMVHIFLSNIRDFYAIETIWPDSIVTLDPS